MAKDTIQQLEKEIKDIKKEIENSISNLQAAKENLANQATLINQADVICAKADLENKKATLLLKQNKLHNLIVIEQQSQPQ